MKKFTLSIVAIMAMGTFAVAGGDIAPVEAPMVVVEPVVDDSGLYLGVAYSYMGLESVISETGSTLVDANVNSGMLQAGYKFNTYIAVEGRYWFGGDENTFVEEDDGYINADVDAWGIYIKPMYPVTEELDIYALLGYASLNYDMNPDFWSPAQTDENHDGFSWGVGMAYAYNDNISIFIDYVSLYDDSNYYSNITTNIVDIKIDTWNFGLTYKF